MSINAKKINLNNPFKYIITILIKFMHKLHVWFILCYYNDMDGPFTVIYNISIIKLK